MSGEIPRREFLRLWALGMVAVGCSRGLPPRVYPGPPPSGLAQDERATLAAAAEALVPGEGLAGARASWAEAFLERRLKAHPEEVPVWGAAARRLEAEARRAHGAPLASLPVERREEVIRAVHSSLADEASLAQDVRMERGVLRALMLAFFVSDHLSLEEAALFSGPPRDVSQPSTPTYSTAGAFPDIHFDRLYAMALGTGDYQRAWATAGYESFPGICKPAEASEGLPRGPRP